MDSSKKVDLKIIIIGALGVGKTSLLHQYVHKTFYEDYRTTLGASILTKVIAVDNTPLKLQIWDTGGQERFRSMVSTFYKGSDGCMLAFDVTDRESFESLENWRDDFLEKVIPREQDFPMVVLGNKIDICDRQVSEEIASAWCKEKHIPYFEVSAKNDINVAQAFETLAKQALTTVSPDAVLLLRDAPAIPAAAPCRSEGLSGPNGLQAAALALAPVPLREGMQRG
nr:PREDICTED: ras-related protein Rab-7b [Apteryx mantelli mantelli]